MSAVVPEANGSASHAPENWEDADFIRALASLERLQNQLDAVRIIPHQVITSLTQPHRTPEIMFRSFRTAAWEGSQSLERLKQSWEDPKTKSLVEACTASERKDPDLTLGRSIDLWGWTQKEEEVSKEQNLAKLSDVAGLAEHEGGAMEELWSGDDKVTMKINVKGKAVNLDFVVTRRLAEGSLVYDGECLGERQENRAISRCLASRKNQGDLKHLLDMIHSYSDLRTAPCVKCSQMVDSHGLLPVARRAHETDSRVKSENDKEWQALHESCLD